MARIPAEVVERLKTEVSVQRLAEARGVELKRHGADLIGRCPFHDDRTPSLVITPAKNLWHCLGACQVGGTVIDWVMKAEGISFRHAVELLQNDGLLLAAAASGSVPPKQSTVKKLPTALQSHQDDAKLLVQVIDFYHQTLLQSPEALAYLQRRGIDSPEALTTFKLGFANRTLGYRLPEKTRVQGAVLRGQLQRIGVLRTSGHEHFSGSIVIPVIAASGEVTESYGRKITPNLREGTPLHLYLPGPHRGVWNAAALGATREVILCEALIDALTFWCAGFRNVTASYGVEGFTADHLACFKQCGIERVLIAYDRDEAGDRAAQKLAPQLMAEGLDCYRIQFPKGLDANEYALKVGPAAKSLGVAIRSAQWLGKGAAPGTGQARPISAAGPILTVETPRVEATAAESTTAPLSRSSLKIALAVAHEPPLAAKEESLSKALTQSTPDATPAAPITSDLPLPAAQFLPAAVIPAAAPPPPHVAAKPLGAAHACEHVIRFGDRRYRVRGLDKNLAYEVLKVNVLVSRTDPGADDPRTADVGEAVHDERGVRTPQDVTRPILERYRRHLYHYRKNNGDPLSFATQAQRLIPLRVFFKWLSRENYILSNPASELELPRVHRRLPAYILSREQIEQVVALTLRTDEQGHSDAKGLRDRAILETFYSSGIRRAELIQLTLYDVDLKNGTLVVREGKGNKDRYVPLGSRAIGWIRRYIEEVRPELVMEPDPGVLFLHEFGEPFSKNRLTDLVKRYVRAAGIGSGACHLFRHAMATHMLNNGADIRFIQAILGHAQLTTTEIYTHVTIAKLKEIHALTHPAEAAAPRWTHHSTDEHELLATLVAADHREDPETDVLDTS